MNYIQEDYKDFSDNFPEDYLDESQFVPSDGLILQVMDKCGNVEDMVMGLPNIKKYINKIDKK